MILLTSTSDVLKIVTVGATEALDSHVDWVDKDGSTITPGRINNTQIVAAGTNTLCPAPTGTAIRNVKGIRITNTNVSAAITVTINHFDGTTTTRIFPSFSLLAGYSLVYDNEEWILYDSSGAMVVTPLAGRWLRRTVISQGTTTFTSGNGTNSIIAKLQAAGGQGGGAPAVTGENGSGGGAGSYAEWAVTVSPNTAYTCAVGAKGSSGGTGATGQTGGITTLAINGVTCTTNGGIGGVAGTSISVPVLGGAGGAVSTNGTVNIAGQNGESSVCTGTAANNRSGAGANSPFGAGGIAKLNASATTGAAATGFGAGGSGGSTTGTATAGGAGSDGIIIIDEYS